jgi:hypothetical protein
VNNLVEKPEKQKVYTTLEIAQILDTTLADVRKIASYYHIEHDVIQEGEAHRAYYTYDAYRLIKERVEMRNNKKTKKVVKNYEPVEEVAAPGDHSLVTDKRCLDLNYWPDTIPDCFKECEE